MYDLIVALLQAGGFSMYDSIPAHHGNSKHRQWRSVGAKHLDHAAVAEAVSSGLPALLPHDTSLAGAMKTTASLFHNHSQVESAAGQMLLPSANAAVTSNSLSMDVRPQLSLVSAATPSNKMGTADSFEVKNHESLVVEQDNSSEGAAAQREIAAVQDAAVEFVLASLIEGCFCPDAKTVACTDPVSKVTQDLTSVAATPFATPDTETGVKTEVFTHAHSMLPAAPQPQQRLNIATDSTHAAAEHAAMSGSLGGHTANHRVAAAVKDTSWAAGSVDAPVGASEGADFLIFTPTSATDAAIIGSPVSIAAQKMPTTVAAAEVTTAVITDGIAAGSLAQQLVAAQTDSVHDRTAPTAAAKTSNIVGSAIQPGVATDAAPTGISEKMTHLGANVKPTSMTEKAIESSAATDAAEMTLNAASSEHTASPVGLAATHIAVGAIPMSPHAAFGSFVHAADTSRAACPGSTYVSAALHEQLEAGTTDITESSDRSLSSASTGNNVAEDSVLTQATAIKQSPGNDSDMR